MDSLVDEMQIESELIYDLILNCVISAQEL